MKIKKLLQASINRFRQVRQNQRDLKIANQHVDLLNVETPDMLEYVGSTGTVDPDDREKLSDFFRSSPLADGELDLSRDKSGIRDML